MVEHLLDISGIGRKRMALKWVSAAEGQLFAEYVSQFSDQTQALGPFNPAKYELQLAATERALNSPRLRWLMGMELQITERGNVFNKKMNENEYRNLLQRAVEEEYEKSLISEVLKDSSQSVREIAFKTGLPVYSVSLRLGEMERRHEAEFQQYEGTVPMFRSMSGATA